MESIDLDHVKIPDLIEGRNCCPRRSSLASLIPVRQGFPQTAISKHTNMMDPFARFLADLYLEHEALGLAAGNRNEKISRVAVLE